MIRGPEGLKEVDLAFLNSFTPEGGGTILPNGVIIEALMVVISAIDPETGQQKWVLWTHCDIPLSQSVGLLEMAKIELIHRTPGAVSFQASTDDDEEP